MEYLSFLAIEYLNKNRKYRRRDFGTPSQHVDLVFLCGRSLSQNNHDPDNRAMIDDTCFAKGNQFVLYAERLTKILAPINLDLLTLEVIMFDLCSGLVIILESFGSACELGAFAANDRNIPKTWVICDKNHIADDSFINLGPIRKIESVSKSRVLFENFVRDGKELRLSKPGMSTLQSISKSVYKKKAFHSDRKTNTGYVDDIGLFARLIVEYVRLFGVLVKKDLQFVFAAFFASQISHFRIKLSSNKCIDERESMRILWLLPDILCELSILEKKDNAGVEYYKLHYASFIKKGISCHSFSSLLFQSAFMLKSDVKRELCRYQNLASKRGFDLW